MANCAYLHFVSSYEEAISLPKLVQNKIKRQAAQGPQGI